MPKGNPSTAQLWQGEVAFFSLDTDLIQSAGYKFDSGALKLLPKQLPETMSLRLPEIVAREIISHRMTGVVKAIESFESSSNELQRLAAIEVDELENCFDRLDVETNAFNLYYKQIVDYAELCQGSILPIQGDTLAQRVFDLYFDRVAPFEERKDKKSEFPDAVSLLLLEDYAKKNGVRGLVASRDGGWASFAETSEHLYCVRSIDELAALFAATDEYAKEVERKVLEAVQSEDSPLRGSLHDALVEHIDNSSWDATDVVGGTVSRVEAKVSDTELEGYSIDSAEVWSISDDKKTWVIELNITATVGLSIDVQFYVWDSIDREEVSLGGNVVPAASSIDVQVYLTCSGVEDNLQPEDWDIEFDIANADYACDPMDVDPDFRD